MASKTIKVMKLLICRYGGIGRHHALKMRCSSSVPVQVRLSAPYAGVAQLEEHAPDKREVVRSGLTVGTTGEEASAFDLFKRRLRY